MQPGASENKLFSFVQWNLNGVFMKLKACHVLCLPACLPVCLSVCLSVSVSVSLSLSLYTQTQTHTDTHTHNNNNNNNNTTTTTTKQQQQQTTNKQTNKTEMCYVNIRESLRTRQQHHLQQPNVLQDVAYSIWTWQHAAGRGII